MHITASNKPGRERTDGPTRLRVIEPHRLVGNGLAALISRRRSGDAKLERLTPREKDVLRLMAEGHPNRDIANQLGISHTTVRTHIRSLGRKLAAHSKLEAIVKGRELGLIS